MVSTLRADDDRVVRCRLVRPVPSPWRCIRWRPRPDDPVRRLFGVDRHGNRGTVRYTEEWLTEDDLRQRMRSDTFSHLITLMEDAAQPPRIEFTLAHETRGLDFVEEVRALTR